MDKTYVKLAELYDSMLEELTNEMDVLGGKVEEFSMDTFSIYVTVDPSLQKYVEDYIAELIIKYDKKRKEIIKSDVFIGVKNILLDNED